MKKQYMSELFKFLGGAIFALFCILLGKYTTDWNLLMLFSVLNILFLLGYWIYNKQKFSLLAFFVISILLILFSVYIGFEKQLDDYFFVSFLILPFFFGFIIPIWSGSIIGGIIYEGLKEG